MFIVEYDSNGYYIYKDKYRALFDILSHWYKDCAKSDLEKSSKALENAAENNYELRRVRDTIDYIMHDLDSLVEDHYIESFAWCSEAEVIE